MMSVPSYVLLTVAFAVVIVAAQYRLRSTSRPLLIQVCAGTGLGANIWCLMSGQEEHGTGLTVITASAIMLGGLAGVLITARPAREPGRASRRVLVVGAHPDDLEIACGATVAKLSDAGHEVHALVLTKGAGGGEPLRREKEAVKGGKMLGVSQVVVLDLPDRRLAHCEREVVDAIEKVMRRFNPDIVLTHSGNDQHADHRAVHVATLQAARSHQAVLCYESPSVTASFDPRVFVDVEDYLDLKIAAMAAHADQGAKPYMSAERVRGNALFRGSQAKMYLAEGFEPVRVPGSVAEGLS
jgi:LmbE family N-acetylglucosaminyl deacetylase